MMKRNRETRTDSRQGTRQAILGIGSFESGEPYNLSLAPGKHILVCGDAGTGKTILFHKMIAELSARNASWVDLVVFDSKGCEYSMPGIEVFKGEKSADGFADFIKDYLASDMESGKTTVFFIDEGYGFTISAHRVEALHALLNEKKRTVVVLSSQVTATLEPFLAQAHTVVLFRSRWDQDASALWADATKLPIPSEMGECIIKPKHAAPLLLRCKE